MLKLPKPKSADGGNLESRFLVVDRGRRGMEEALLSLTRQEDQLSNDAPPASRPHVPADFFSNSLGYWRGVRAWLV